MATMMFSDDFAHNINHAHKRPLSDDASFTPHYEEAKEKHHGSKEVALGKS